VFPKGCGVSASLRHACSLLAATGLTPKKDVSSFSAGFEPMDFRFAIGRRSCMLARLARRVEIARLGSRNKVTHAEEEEERSMCPNYTANVGPVVVIYLSVL
jgi:hypothetical protein